MIEVKNITKSFGALQVLKGINLTIEKGEIVAIMGASGAGKTTLLQIIGTLLKPDSGLIKLNNTDVINLRDKYLAKFRNQHIGFVFQFHHLLPEFTALENVCIPAFVGKTPRNLAESKAEEILKFLNLEDRLEHKPNELSGGEQQRVAVARALINNPDVILADEPSGNLDTKNKKELHNLFFSLRDKYDQTIVIVTHDKELANMSDRMLNMHDGKITD
ncbi:MAG: ABC transporter ATP-binding protein [Bacteroidales bacterium]|nr:MAG: ABC transporter ATP-binding protein [Bacteroidales bacterium]